MSGEARPAGRPDAGPGRRRRGRRGPAAGGAGGPGRARPAWRRGAASAGPAEAPSPRGVPGRVAPGAPGRAAGSSPPRPRDRAGRTCGRSATPPGPRLSRSGRPRLQAAARASLWRGRRPLSPRFVPVVPSAALRPRGAARPRLAGSSGPNPEPPAPLPASPGAPAGLGTFPGQNVTQCAWNRGPCSPRHGRAVETREPASRPRCDCHWDGPAGQV